MKSLEQNLKIVKTYESETYGTVVLRKICEISIHTFDAEKQEKMVDDFFKYHPKNIFNWLSIEPIVKGEVFALWLPLQIDNPKIKNTIKMKQVIKWYKNAKQFMSWKNDELLRGE